MENCIHQRPFWATLGFPASRDNPACHDAIIHLAALLPKMGAVLVYAETVCQTPSLPIFSPIQFTLNLGMPLMIYNDDDDDDDDDICVRKIEAAQWSPYEATL